MRATGIGLLGYWGSESFLSGRGEAGAQKAERYLQESGAEWTVVGCFNQNFDENFADSVRSGVSAMPAGTTAEPFADADDIADVVVASAMRFGEPGSTMRFVAGAIYVAGVVLTTVGYHVPRNNRLDQFDPESPEGAGYWAVHLKEWVSMNHVRSKAPFVSAVMLAVSLTVG